MAAAETKWRAFDIDCPVRGTRTHKSLVKDGGECLMPKSGAGPGGKGTINPDSFQQDSPPPAAMPTTAVKVINPTDKKTGPPKPAGLGGTTTSGHGNQDDFWE